MRRDASVLLALLATVLPTAAAPASLLGNWFGSGQPNDKSEMYIDHFLPGGVFRAEHRTCRKGQAFDFPQTGSWLLAGDRLTIHVATERGSTWVPRDDVYRITRLDAHKQVSIYLQGNFTYNDTRVDDGFRMPECDLTS